MSDLMIPVDVYWNLHKGGWSVRNRRTGRVIQVVPDLSLVNCEFVVQPAGREKVRREKRKTVHAFVRGEYWPHFMHTPIDEVLGVTYNPYRDDTFIIRGEGNPIYNADIVELTTNEEGKGQVKAILLEPGGKVLTPIQQVSCVQGQEEGGQA